MENPKISVVMSVYNSMLFLKEAVKSILGQTFKNFEFIIVNDASTDDSLKYLKSQKDPRIKVINNVKNLGLAASLNKGLKVAKGDYIARMDADDVSLPKRFEKQIKFLTTHPEIDICGTAVYSIDERGENVGSKARPTKDRDIKRSLGIYPCIIHPTFMGKRSFFMELGGYREEFDGAEEYDLLMRARDKFKMANLSDKLLKWRLTDSRRSIKMMQAMNKLDVRIKWESLKRGAVDIFSLYGFLKMIVMAYFVPIKVKARLARLLKIA